MCVGVEGWKDGDEEKEITKRVTVGFLYCLATVFLPVIVSREHHIKLPLVWYHTVHTGLPMTIIDHIVVAWWSFIRIRWEK